MDSCVAHPEKIMISPDVLPSGKRLHNYGNHRDIAG